MVLFGRKERADRRELLASMDQMASEKPVDNALSSTYRDETGALVRVLNPTLHPSLHNLLAHLVGLELALCGEYEGDSGYEGDSDYEDDYEYDGDSMREIYDGDSEYEGDCECDGYSKYEDDSGYEGDSDYEDDYEGDSEYEGDCECDGDSEYEGDSDYEDVQPPHVHTCRPTCLGGADEQEADVTTHSELGLPWGRRVCGLNPGSGTLAPRLTTGSGYTHMYVL
uniref:Uncharacterized protein n=1 Tax=Timema cristinae TaxID=61476 RepID=A0A7R9DBP0_TIMCR|nr:unnamed protein product [Timema cristinae]